MLKVNYKRLIKKLGMIFLSTILCVVLIFNAGFIDCFAVAGVDDALFLLLVAICASCGITFGSVALAEAGTSALYDNMDSSTRTFVDDIAEKIKAKLEMDSITGSLGVALLASVWDAIVKAVIATFGTYEAVSTITNLSIPGFTGVSPGNPFEYTVTCDSSSVTQYQIYNMTHTIIGYDVTGYPVPSYLTLSQDKYTEILSIANGVFECCWADYGGSTLSATESIRYYIDWLSFSGCDRTFDGSMYFNGIKLISKTSGVKGGFILTANGVNIVQNGYIMGTSVAVPESVCPDGVWNSDRAFSDWLNDLIFGDIALPGNPGIDAVSYPGNDVWHDGSINDDIAVGSPSIGIAVPTTGDDVISLNPDKARDYASTDTKIGDVAGSDTTTGDTTGDSSGDTTGNPPKNGNTGALPALSLPEILFKEKFPFCLPWDLYSLFVVLNAEPKVPKFEIPFVLERFGVNESITIDLSPFEEQVEIVRFFLGAGFVLALILISRKMIGAG